MNEKLDTELCTKYPKLFVNRNAPMQETCMCWGFSHGDGWYNIINQLCANIQDHIDWKERQQQAAIKYNEMAAQCKDGSFELFEEQMQSIFNPETKEKRKQEIINNKLRTVPHLCPQVTVDQVKEKFGTLRFYYSGGDEYISGLVSMAESISAVTCEECGNPGTQVGGGWITTLCKEHAEARGIYVDNKEDIE
jgi:hypothetical protein